MEINLTLTSDSIKLQDIGYTKAFIPKLFPLSSPNYLIFNF